MDITIDKTNENPYLSRKEVHGKVSFTGATPSHKQFTDALATKVNAKADAIFVQHVYTRFGSQQATFEAHIYANKEQLGKVVRLGKKAKEKLAKGTAAPTAAPAAAPAEAAKPEARPSEKAEEKKEAPAAKAEKPAEKKTEAKPEAKKEEPKPAEKAEAKKEEPKPAEKAEAKKEEPKKAGA